MWAGREGKTELNLLCMFEEISLEHRAMGFRIYSNNPVFSQRDIFDYIKRGYATDGILKFNDILLEQVTQEFRQGLL
jgi:hypothetical protein